MTIVQLLQSSPALFAFVALLFGLLIGSFLNVVIHRVPLMMESEWRKQCAELAAQDVARDVKRDAQAQAARSAAGTSAKGGASAAAGVAQPAREAKFNLVTPRSRCPACQEPIRAWQNIPVLSYLLLRGRCAGCGTRISIRYPVVELATGILSAFIAWHFGFGWLALAALVFTWCLIALAGIDIDHHLLPDNITLPLMWLGLIASLYHSGDPLHAFPVDPRSSIIGAAAGYLSLWSIFHLFKLVTGKEGMGYGDFKLFAAFGAWFGWQMLLPIILVASLAGSVIGIALIAMRRLDRRVHIPFGPYLAVAGWIALAWGAEIRNFMSGIRIV